MRSPPAECSTSSAEFKKPRANAPALLSRGLPGGLAASDRKRNLDTRQVPSRPLECGGDTLGSQDAPVTGRCNARDPLVNNALAGDAHGTAAGTPSAHLPAAERGDCCKVRLPAIRGVDVKGWRVEVDRVERLRVAKVLSVSVRCPGALRQHAAQLPVAGDIV